MFGRTCGEATEEGLKAQRGVFAEFVSQFGLAVRLSFLFKNCGLWTLSCDFVPHNDETLKWLSSLPILMQESF